MAATSPQRISYNTLGNIYSYHLFLHQWDKDFYFKYGISKEALKNAPADKHWFLAREDVTLNQFMEEEPDLLKPFRLLQRMSDGMCVEFFYPWRVFFGIFLPYSVLFDSALAYLKINN